MYNLVFYHGGCPDGYTASFIYWYYCKLNYGLDIANTIEFIPCFYSSTKEVQSVKDKKVLILDFSYKYEILKNMIDEALEFLIIDHHKTAMLDLEKIDDKYKKFDMNESGASLTWLTFFKEEMPLLIKYVRAYDIWTKDQPFTDEFNSGFELYPKTYPDYELLLNSNLEIIIEKGKAIMEYRNSLMIDIIKTNDIFIVDIDDKYHICAYISSPLKLMSEAGNKILKLNNYLDFSIIYRVDISKNIVNYSLRSIEFDVSLLAQKFGGGGHKCASGFSQLGSTLTEVNVSPLNPKGFNGTSLIKIPFTHIEIDIFKYIYYSTDKTIKLNNVDYIDEKFKDLIKRKVKNVEKIYNNNGVLLYSNI